MTVGSYVMQMYTAWKWIRNFQIVMGFFFSKFVDSCFLSLTNSYVNSSKAPTVRDDKIMCIECFGRILARESRMNSSYSRLGYSVCISMI